VGTRLQAGHEGGPARVERRVPRSPTRRDAWRDYRYRGPGTDGGWRALRATRPRVPDPLPRRRFV